MPTSPKQLASNRRNALKSTGPRTSQGKDAVHLNALTHGILARETVIDHPTLGENAAEFTLLLDHLSADLLPHGPLEDLLVQQLAACYWRLRRILRADAREFAAILRPLDQTVNGPGLAIPIPAPTMPSPARLETILRYEQALQRQISAALAHLDRLQAQRRGEPTSPTVAVHITES